MNDNVDNLLDKWAHEESKMQITDNDYKQASLYAVLNDLQQKGEIEYYAPDGSALLSTEALDVLVDWHIRDNPSFFSEATEDMNEVISDDKDWRLANGEGGKIIREAIWHMRCYAEAATLKSDAWDKLLCEMRSDRNG